MDKIKHVMSNRKSAEAAREGENPSSTTNPSHGVTAGRLSGEGSHFAGTQHSPLPGTTSSEGYHPIYDEFKAGHEQTPATGTHLTGSHIASGNQEGSAMPLTQHNAPSQRQNALIEGDSTASIKSGVIGFPQGERDAHASLTRNPFSRELHHDQVQTANTANLPDRTLGGGQKESSHIGRDGALGAAAVGAGAAATHGLHHQKGDVSSTHQTYASDYSDPSNIEVAHSTDRSFPLAGGVIGERHVGPSSAVPTTHDRETTTKERDIVAEEGRGHGREALAGAAAAATVSSAVPLSHNTHERELTREHENVGLGDTSRDVTAASAYDPMHGRDQEGHGHFVEGDLRAGAPMTHTGTVFAKGPHETDTANRLDPRLHIPGEYPDPTPVEETPEPSFSHDEGVGAASTDTRDFSKTTTDHHYGRDAAIAGGAGAAGAAGLGALAGAKHHQGEPTDIEGRQYPIESSPYSSKSVDPRVYGKQSSPPKIQDPLRSTSERDAAMATGFQTVKPQSRLQEGIQPSTSRQETSQLGAPTQGEESKHHYGRDAGLAAAGAAAAGGLYASQRDGKPDTGPASETIGPHKSNIANVVDPRVQPDPSLQRHQVGSTSTPQDPASMTIGPHKSNVANILDPRVQPDPNKQKPHSATDQAGNNHHHGRDAAAVGGVGAAGYGAYEAGKAYDSHRSTQPAASMNEQRYDPTAPGAHDPTTASKVEPGHVHYPSRGGLEEPYNAGAGVTVAGASAYAASRNAPESSFAKQLSHDEPAQGTQGAEQHSQHHYARDAAVVGGLGAAGAGAYAATRGNDDTRQPEAPRQTQHQRFDSAQLPDQYKQKHDAPTAGVAGVAAAGAAGYGLSQHDADKAEKERLKAREREAEKEHKTEEKGEKKHHFFGFLHRDKKDKDKPRSASGSPRGSHEYPADTGVGPAGSYESTSHAIPHDEDSDGTRERRKLHKNPPVGHPARGSMESEKHQHVGTDGLIGRPEQISGDHTTRSGVYGAHEPEGLQHTAAEPHTRF